MEMLKEGILGTIAKMPFKGVKVKCRIKTNCN